MTFTRRSSLLALAGAIALAAPIATPANAQTKLKLVLNWKYQGPQGWFFIAEDKGYFKEEGLEITIDQGDGSATPIPKVASGTYDIGFGDINALIEFAAKKPEEAPIAVYVMYNRPPFTIAVKTDSPIKTPKDLEGKTLGGAANDGALKLFPAFAKLAKIDESKITITNFQPNLREQMLMRGQADGVFGYVNTIRSRPSFPASIPTRNCAGSITVTTAWTFIPTPSSSRRNSSRKTRKPWRASFARSTRASWNRSRTRKPRSPPWRNASR